MKYCNTQFLAEAIFEDLIATTTSPLNPLSKWRGAGGEVIKK